MTEPRVVTDRAAFRRAAAGAPSGTRVPVEVRVEVGDPFAAYRRARRGPGGFYLETSGGQTGWSYFGVEPVSRLQVGSEAQALPNDASGGGSGAVSPTLASLAGLLDGESLSRGDCPVPYPCGAFGWVSYDVARELEDLPDATRDDRGLPRLQVGVYETVAAWEEPREGETTLHVTSCPRVGSAPGAAFDRGRDRALALARDAIEGDRSIGRAPTGVRHVRFESECGREAFADRVRRVKTYIRDGDTFQANVSHRLTAPASVHPVAVFDALRRVNPAPYSGLLEFPGVDLVSASPELLVEVAGDRVVTEPIAGTRPRGETPEADADLEAELLTDEKERAEHAMLVDLERNDLGKVCAVGSVEVRDYRRVDRYSEVMHLVSVVDGRLREDVGLADTLAAVFPGGTITGAPKPRTLEIIDEVEETRRGPYTGGIGAFGFDGRATMNIVIRTLVRTGDQYGLRVGAGIVHDSQPEREYEETLDKARALISAVDEAVGERATFAVER